MKELQNILAQIRELKSSGGAAVLATVVDVQGSSYRLPSARMLILESGEFFGTVSGGCLEADVLERAKQVLKTGEPQVLTYDTRTNDESVFALNMGCRGVIRILLEPTPDNDFFAFVADCFRTRLNGVVATVIDRKSAAGFAVGTRFSTLETDLILFNKQHTGFETLTPALRAAILDVFGIGQTRCQTFQTADGWVEFFIELIKPPLALVVFGAGADAVPLVRLAKDLGWFVTVVDHRSVYATPERFPGADQVSIARAEDLELDVIHDRNAVAVVMTHNFERDKRALRRALNGRFRYVGVLGPKRRTETLLQELANEGEIFSGEQLERLFAPIGLDIGADAPESIAVSIVAEIQAALSNRAGGFLKNRQGSIYNRK